jgi:hypothetical protein
MPQVSDLFSSNCEVPLLECETTPSKFVIFKLQAICLGQTKKKTSMIALSSNNPHKVSKIYSCDHKSVQLHISDTCRRRQLLLGGHILSAVLTVKQTEIQLLLL